MGTRGNKNTNFPIYRPQQTNHMFIYYWEQDWHWRKEPKCLLPDTFSYLKIYLNALVTGTSPRTPLERLTVLHKPISCCWRPLLGGEGKGNIRKGETGRKREDMERKKEGIDPKRRAVCALPEMRFPQALLSSYVPGRRFSGRKATYFSRSYFKLRTDYCVFQPHRLPVSERVFFQRSGSNIG